MFEHAVKPGPDSLMLVAQRVREDSRAHKLDLGVGVYRDAFGKTPVLPVVLKAANRLRETETTKSYLPPSGDPEFVELLKAHVLGSRIAQELGERVVGAQALGGTGALRLAAELIAQTRPNAAVWLGIPSWPNHEPVMSSAGLRVETFDAVDLSSQALLFDDTVATLRRAAPGDLVILQGCCHNPSGIDYTAPQWEILADVMAEGGLVPILDFAYHGLGDGLEEDALGVRMIADRLPECLIAASCSKSFSLYRERTGLLIVKTRSAQAAQAVGGMLSSIVRVLYSNPPSHGASLVRTVLKDPELCEEWRIDLEEKRRRIVSVRSELSRVAAEHQIDLASVADQKGLFSTLPIAPAEVRRLASEFAVHLPETGRINIAGLSLETIPLFVSALIAVRR